MAEAQSAPAARRTIPTRQLRFGVLCVLGYVALSWTARFDMRLHEQDTSLLYPLDTFSMYARPPGEDRSLLLVRTADGVVHSVTDFRAFACAEPILGSGARCAETRGILYHFEDLARYIETHPGSGTVDVELITRTWDIEPGKPPVHRGDCVVTRCRVAR